MKSLALLLATALLLAGCTSDEDPDPAPADTGDEHDDHGDDHGDDAGDDHGDDAGDDTGTGGGDDGADTGAEDDAGSDDGTDTGGGDDAMAANTPPIVDLLADTLSADVPFNVTFTFEGSDADGDELSWTFDADGDGTADTEGTGLPFNFTYSYTDAGNFTALLSVTDGEATAEDSLTIEATAAAVVSGPEPFTFTGDVVAPCAPCPVQYSVCIGLNAGAQGLDCIWTDIPVELQGATATFESSSGAVSFDFMDGPDCTGDGIGFGADAASPAQAEIPFGTACILVYDSTFPASSLSLTIEP